MVKEFQGEEQCKGLGQKETTCLRDRKKAGGNGQVV
jgi:hypothetical protein